MKKLVFASVAMLALAAGNASAADAPAAVYDWTGFYIGLNAGYGFGGNDDVGVSATGNQGELNVSGIFGGGQIGYNMQHDAFVFGIEGDIQLSGISDDDQSRTTDSESDVDWFGTLRGRAGYAVDNLLIYGTGGLAYAGIDYSVLDQFIDVDDNYSQLGYAVGGGIEYAFDESWSMKAEYLYIGLGKEKLSGGGSSTYATPSFHSVRLGVNYSF